MKQLVFCLVAAILSGAGFSFEVTLSDAAGRPFASEGRIAIRQQRHADAFGVETIRCTLTGLADTTQLVRAVVSAELPGATVVWDGRDEIPVAKAAFTRPLLMDNHFLMGAMWNGERGVALASGAEDHTSYEDLVSEPGKDGVRLSLAVHVALLGKGSVYSCTFHRIAFAPKYGIRDALARYYPLYPVRFTRCPKVNPAVYGISAEYASWRFPDPEACRFMNATWEWCHGAGRSWGDPLNQEVPTGRPNVDYTWDSNMTFALRDRKCRRLRNEDLPVAEFDRVQGARFASAYYCGVANGFYMMALANISNKIAGRYPDSVGAGNTIAPNDYFYSTEIFTFPECAWGREIRRQLAALVQKHDLGAIAFDVSRPRSVYRGARLRDMANVGWDKFGPGVVRGVGSAKLFDYIRTLPNKRLSGNCGVIVNTKYQHLTDMLYMDTMMIESTPWDHSPPFPLAMRFALGEKGLTLWEGYDPRSFDPNYNNWSRAERHLIPHDLGRYAVHRSFATGASLPGTFLTEYVSLCSHAFVRMNEAGFKPVPGARVAGDRWELARYGLGEKCYLALCNETNAVRTADVTVFPAELATGLVADAQPGVSNGFVFAPFFGGTARQTLGGDTQRVVCTVGPLLVNVLEAVGTAEGAGELSAEWQGDGVEVRLALESKSFMGTVALRDAFGSVRRAGARAQELRPGSRIVVAYRDDAFAQALAPLRTFAFMDGKKPAFALTCAEDGGDSRDMADRIGAFFWSLTKPEGLTQSRLHKHVCAVPCTGDAALAAHTVVLADAAGRKIVLTAADREAHSALVRRFLNALNALRFPDYAPAVRMTPAERACLPRIPRW